MGKEIGQMDESHNFHHTALEYETLRHDRARPFNLSYCLVLDVGQVKMLKSVFFLILPYDEQEENCSAP